MKVALIADVHSNQVALNAVLQDARNQKVSEVWFLGDLVGYGPLPMQVWGLCCLGRPSWRWALAGNHDWGLLGLLGDSLGLPPEPGERAEAGMTSTDFNRIAGEALRKNIQAVPEVGQGRELRAWLEKRPLMISPRAGVYLTHGAFSPRRPENCLKEYLERGEGAEASWQAMKLWFEAGSQERVEFVASDEGWGPPRLLIVGHRHFQLAWRRDPNASPKHGRWRRLIPGFGAPPNSGDEVATLRYDPARVPEPFEVEAAEPLVSEEDDCPTFVNPGSVGLPRDGARAGEGWALAKYAIIDWSEPGGRLRFRQIPYELDPVKAALGGAGYPPEIADWLTR